MHLLHNLKTNMNTASLFFFPWMVSLTLKQISCLKQNDNSKAQALN